MARNYCQKCAELLGALSDASERVFNVTQSLFDGRGEPDEQLVEIRVLRTECAVIEERLEYHRICEHRARSRQYRAG